MRISLGDGPLEFLPGDELDCEYNIDLRSADPVRAVETSVIWITSGKGEEDIGVHFFERRQKKSLDVDQLRQTHRLRTVLPASPLSYDGQIVQVSWCVRVRVIFARGNQTTHDQPFRLGQVSSLTDR